MLCLCSARGTLGVGGIQFNNSYFAMISLGEGSRDAAALLDFALRDLATKVPDPFMSVAFCEDKIKCNVWRGHCVWHECAHRVASITGRRGQCATRQVEQSAPRCAHTAPPGEATTIVLVNQYSTNKFVVPYQLSPRGNNPVC